MSNNRLTGLISKIKPYNIKKGLLYLKHYGLKEFCIRLSERLEPEDVPYDDWYKQYAATEQDLLCQSRHKFKYCPLISIVVPAYHTPEVFLTQMIDSVLSQSYPNWELVIGNASPDDSKMLNIFNHYCSLDHRIKIIDIPDNLGIAQNTNATLASATGEYIGLMDHDDILAPDALFEIAIRLEKDHEIDIFYTDEDKVTADLSEHLQPNLKPDFNIDLLRSNNYICHFFVFRKSLMDFIGNFDPDFDGAQDYDFIFRCTEQSKNICHIPRVLYHWRTHSTSTADNPVSKLYAYDAGKRAIESHLKREGISATVSLRSDFGFYDVKYNVTGNPLVSIVIPNKDQSETLKQCINSILEKATYNHYEIIIVENNSTDPKTFELYNSLSKIKNIKIVTYPHKGFNYSAINNYGVSNSNGDYLLFLNNDIEVITPDFIEQLLGNCQRHDVGAVGAKLYYPDNTIQHAGVIIGIGGIAGHAFLGLSRPKSGYLHKASLQMNVSAVTAACMMVKRDLFQKIDGFEEKLSVAFNDIDLCLRIRECNHLIVYNPHVEMYHYESKSRGTEDNVEKVRRFQTEIEFMRTRWINLLKEGDPCYNPNLTLASWHYSLRADGKGIKPWHK